MENVNDFIPRTKYTTIRYNQVNTIPELVQEEEEGLYCIQNTVLLFVRARPFLRLLSY